MYLPLWVIWFKADLRSASGWQSREPDLNRCRRSRRRKESESLLLPAAAEVGAISVVYG